MSFRWIRPLALALTASLGFAACAGDDSASSEAQNVTAKTGAQVELFRSANDAQFYFRLKANNGKTILVGEGYRARAGVEGGIVATLDYGKSLDYFELLPSSNNPDKRSDGGWYFNIKALNTNIVATSEVYSSKSNAKKGMKTVSGYILGKPTLDDWADQCGHELFEGADEQLYFRLRARNGEIVLSSEGYTTEASAKGGINSVVVNGVDESGYELLEASNGKFYFNLKAANGETVATSQMYTTQASAKQGITTVVGLLGEQTACFSDESGDGHDDLTCKWGWGSEMAEDSTELRESLVGDTFEASMDNVDSLTKIQSQQIYRTAVYLGGMYEDEGLDVAFDTTDEGIFYMETLQVEGVSYDWVRSYMGDTEVGVVFEAGTETMVLEVSDGDLRSCVHLHDS